MNEKNAYEKSLAEKLGQIPPPGSASKHWPQMKALLDKDLPEGGAKGPGGFGRWWLFALVGTIVITAGWWFSNGNSNQKEDAQAISKVNSPATENEKLTTKANSKKSDKDDLNFTPSVNNQESAKAGNDVSVIPPATEEHNTIAPASTTKRTETAASSTKGTEIAVTHKQPIKTTEPQIVTASETKKNTISGDLVIAKNKAGSEKNETLILASDAGSATNSVSKKEPKKESISAGSSLAIETVAGKSRYEKTVKAFSAKRSNDYTGLANTDKGRQSASVVSLTSLPDNGSVKAKPSIIRIVPEALSTSFTGPDVTEPVSPDYALAVEPLPSQIPAPSRFKMETARTKALKNRIVGTGDDKQFVLGLSLPLAFPIGAQANLAYNINAGANTLSDFVPIPHFQYHLSDKAYFQTELQFIAPQFIQSFKVYEKKREVVSATNYRFLTSTINVQKLYYFNVPVVAYYSPFKNFYLGTGIQYSKLLSGIANYEDWVATSMQPGASDSLVRSEFRKFRKDSVSNKLAGHDFRFIFDANYYWHRFTVGMRYTQALSDFVSIQLTNNTPVYTDRNKALQFYLRYNIWEDKRKKKPALVAWR